MSDDQLLRSSALRQSVSDTLIPTAPLQLLMQEMAYHEIHFGKYDAYPEYSQHLCWLNLSIG